MSKDWSEFFEEAVSDGADSKAAANWMTGDLAGLLNEHHVELSASKVRPRHVTDLVKLLAAGAIGSAAAKTALAEAFESGASIEQIVDERGLRQVSDSAALDGIVQEVIAENPGPAEQFRGGKEGALNALIGHVMKKTRGAADPQVAAEILRRRLSG